MIDRKRITLYLKGMAMGAADVVPGVSGGTIAFISGIYEELIGSIKSIGLDTVGVLRKEGLASAWRSINGNFLVTLVAGIITSILLLARPITWALQHHPVLVWSFFFGLILASVWLCGKLVKHWGAGPIIGVLIGAATAVMVGVLKTGSGGDSLLFFYLSGCLAICAMILPGISGAFILLLLGAYQPIMEALKGFDLPIILVFIAGCLTGLMAFSRFLSWLFRTHHDLAVSALTGFLVGSLYIVWPWKKVLSLRTVHEGKPDEHLEPLLTGNVWPGDYSTLNDMDVMLGISSKDPQVLPAVLLCLAGIALLLILERSGPAST
ncbi:MAG: DUF368 domain-containing protein [Flavobacteriales bacterium]|nr:DUF368 domain-containing protein [Flavobacteriales bacterium]